MNAVFRTDWKGQQQKGWDATAVMQEKVMNLDSRLAELDMRCVISNWKRRGMKVGWK